MTGKYLIHQIIRYGFPMEYTDKPRPCAIIDLALDGNIIILSMSSKNYGNEPKFFIPDSDPDFQATGLGESSYIYSYPILNIPKSLVIEHVGYLTGSLEKRFEKWI